MQQQKTIIGYAPTVPQRRRVPTIIWWFAVNAVIFIGGVGYMMIEFEKVGPYRDLPPREEHILTLWMFGAQAMFLFLLGWAGCGWWRSRRKT